MQNNFYYNFSPQFMHPQNIPVDPYMSQQMAYYQVNMLGNFPQQQQQHPFQPYYSPQQFQMNQQNNN